MNFDFDEVLKGLVDLVENNLQKAKEGTEVCINVLFCILPPTTFKVFFFLAQLRMAPEFPRQGETGSQGRPGGVQDAQDASPQEDETTKEESAW